MSTGKDRVIQAAQRTDESGHERDDGRWVDPLPVQAVAIDEAFKQAADDREFDIWTVVPKDATLREENTVAENFDRVFDRWRDQAERGLEESQIAEDLERRMEEMEQEGDG